MFFFIKNISICFTVVISLCANAALADKLAEYNAYANEYDKLEESCQHILASRTDDAPIRWRNCVWSGDKMLLLLYNYNGYFSDVAYERYSAHFAAAKNAAMARMKGTEWITPWAEATDKINRSYHRILKRLALQ